MRQKITCAEGAKVERAREKGKGDDGSCERASASVFSRGTRRPPPLVPIGRASEEGTNQKREREKRNERTYEMAGGEKGNMPSAALSMMRFFCSGGSSSSSSKSGKLERSAWQAGCAI